MLRPKPKWKSSDVSGRAASSSDSLPKAKKSKTTDSMDSGVLQPTDFQVRIVFTDAGCITSRLQQSLIKEERVHLQTDDLVETAEVFDAPIIIGSYFPADTPPKDSHMSSRLCHTRGIHATSWHIWYDEETWSVTQFRSVPMSDNHSRLRDREYAIMHLCHDRGYEIAVMFVKVLKGKQAAADTLQLNYSERQEVLDIAFRFLAKPRDCPVIVAGDFGVGLSTMHDYIRRNALQEQVQTHCIKNQSFHALFRSAKPGYQCTSINTHSQRMIALQIEFNSGDPHPTQVSASSVDGHVDKPAALARMSRDVSEVASSGSAHSAASTEVLWLVLEESRYDAIASGRLRWEARPRDGRRREWNNSPRDPCFGWMLAHRGRSVVLQRGMGTGTYRKHAKTLAVKIAQVRIFSSAHQMLKFGEVVVAADLVPNCTDPIKFYIHLYGGAAYNHAFVAMRFERPDEATL